MFDEIETPAVLVDLDTVERNIARFQAHCDETGIAARPHIKTHKLPEMAQRQVAAGAVGITCQKVGEAEVMAAAGLDDIFITYNILGDSKVARLAKLAREIRMSVVADNPTVVDGLSRGFAGEDAPLQVLVECDTGAGRCGVQTPGEALNLARRIHAAPGLTLGGLMTFPPMKGEARVDAWLNEARALLLAEGLPCPRVSSGGTPNMWRSGDVKTATEHRAGTYIYNDRSLVEGGVCGPADCALTVLTTVVSRPTDTRGIVDAGSKVLTTDLFGLTGHGLIAAAPTAEVKGLSEEHGILDLTQSNFRPEVGARVRVIPNHACVVTNMMDRLYLVRGDEVVSEVAVAARGKVT